MRHKLRALSRTRAAQPARRGGARNVPSAFQKRAWAGFQHPIAAARLPYRAQQPLAHGLGKLCVEDALDAAASCSTRSVLARLQKSLERLSVAKLTPLGEGPGLPWDFQQSFALQNSGSRHKNLPFLALERTSPNFHMLAWPVILFCLQLKKNWSEHAKLLEPRPCLCVLCCVGGNC